MIAGFVLRVAWISKVDKESALYLWDGREFYAYGKSLVALQWDNYPRFFNDIRPPFYPIFLMPFLALNDHAVWHIQLFQCGLGVLQAIILAKIAGRWAGQRAGNWTFAIVMFHPFLIYYCGFILTETLFITLLWFGILCLQRFEHGDQQTGLAWLVSAAVAFAFACLTRPPLQLFLPIAALWLGWRIWRATNWKHSLARVTVFTAIISGLLLPWLIGNYLVHGEFTLSPGATSVAYTLGNSSEYLRMYEAPTKDEYYAIAGRLTEKYSLSGEPPEAWLEEARDFRQNHTADWWRLQWFKLKHFWTPWLNPLIFPRSQVLLSMVSATPLFIFGFVELWRRRRRVDPVLVLLLGLIATALAGLVFPVQVRYRIPYVDVSLLLLTASLISQLRVAAIKPGFFKSLRLRRNISGPSRDASLEEI